MTDFTEILQQLRKAEGRIQHLEDVNRRVLDALDFVASLGDFQAKLTPEQDPSVILEATRTNLSRIGTFRVRAFLMLGDDDLEMTLKECDPESERAVTQGEIDRLIDEGTFALGTQSESPPARSRSSHPAKCWYSMPWPPDRGSSGCLSAS